MQYRYRRAHSAGIVLAAMILSLGCYAELAGSYYPVVDGDDRVEESGYGFAMARTQLAMSGRFAQCLVRTTVIARGTGCASIPMARYQLCVWHHAPRGARIAAQRA